MKLFAIAPILTLPEGRFWGPPPPDEPKQSKPEDPGVVVWYQGNDGQFYRQSDDRPWREVQLEEKQKPTRRGLAKTLARHIPLRARAGDNWHRTRLGIWTLAALLSISLKTHLENYSHELNAAVDRPNPEHVTALHCCPRDDISVEAKNSPGT